MAKNVTTRNKRFHRKRRHFGYPRVTGLRGRQPKSAPDTSAIPWMKFHPEKRST